MTKNKVRRVSKTPTTELPKLWEIGFFKDWRTASDVAAEFSKRGYHFGASAVSKALSRAGFITPKGKGKGTPIKYIQTYPFEK